MEQPYYKKLMTKRTDTLFMAAIVMLFLLKIALLFSPIRSEAVITTYFAPLTVAMIVYLLMRAGIPRKPALLLPPVFALWFAITRLMNGDWYLRQSSINVYMVFLSCCVLFIAPSMLSAKQRTRLMNTIALVYSLVFSAIAWVAVIAAITGNPWVNPLDSNSILGINDAYSNPYRLNILNIHPNVSAALFYTALALLCYLFFHTRRIWLRVLYGLAALGLCVAIILTGSLSAIGISGAILGLALIAVVISRHRLKTRFIILVIAAVALAAVGALLLYTPVLQLAHSLQQSVIQQEETVAVDTAQETSEVAQTQDDSEAETAAFAQERLQTSSMKSSMNGRLKIYSSAFLSIADRPITLVIGELQQAAMDRSAKVINFPLQNHLHNSFLQTLVVGGGISCLIILAFTVLLVIYSIRLFFRKSIPLHQKMLVLVPFALLCHSMLEALLFIDARILNMLFFFIAGMIIVCVEEASSTAPASR
ncbi:MAG TPA: O-antigen ligase family protein [Candidatus Limiplasma sp.]|nr:O-antigen ligase family protein [Candidatus Limiplasma sp.]